MASREFIEKIQRCGVRGLCHSLVMLEESPAGSGNWVGHCPNPDHEDSTPSFWVYENRNTTGIESWCCQGCHVGGKDIDKKDGVTDPNNPNFGSDNIAFMRWITFHRDKKLLSFPEALKKVAEFYGIPMESTKFSGIYQKNRNNMMKWEMQMTPFVRMYLKTRGLDDTDIQKWHLGFDGERITMPIFNSIGDVIGFSNRAFTDEAERSGSKYINTPERYNGRDTGFHKGSVFYGIQHIDRRDNRLFIFEGQFDAILASKYGVPNAVAIMTCHMTKEQAEYIAKQKLLPIVCFDPDEAGRMGALKTMERLQEADVTDSRVLFLPDDRDMADLARDLKGKTCETILPLVMPFYQYLLKGMADEMDAAVLQKQNEIMPRAEKVLSGIRDKGEQERAKGYFERRMRMWSA